MGCGLLAASPHAPPSDLIPLICWRLGAAPPNDAVRIRTTTPESAPDLRAPVQQVQHCYPPAWLEVAAQQAQRAIYVR